MTPIDLTGSVFGVLTVESLVGTNRHGKRVWRCRCGCGTVVERDGSELRRGNSTSCGCQTADRLSAAKRRHGMRDTPEYQTWVSMIARTTNERWRDFSNYGGRGITVCARWRGSFAAFYADVGPRPSEDHSLDRFPSNDGDYEPGNVRWATRAEQGRNKRSNRRLTWNGETLTMTAWGERLGIRPGTISERLRRGWPVERALSVIANHAPDGCPDYPRAAPLQALQAALAAAFDGEVERA